VSNLANKLVNPFANMKKKLDSNTNDELTSSDSQVDLRHHLKRQCFLVNNNDDLNAMKHRTVLISPLKRTRDTDDDDEQREHRKVQVFNVNQEIRRPTGLFSYENDDDAGNDDDDEKPHGNTRKNVTYEE
jgi:hypothetical protein